MMPDDVPWEYHHHHSYLLDSYENNISDLYWPNVIEKNFSNIEEAIPLDISIKPRIIKNVHIGASFSSDEIKKYKALFQEFRDIFA